MSGGVEYTEDAGWLERKISLPFRNIHFMLPLLLEETINLHGNASTLPPVTTRLRAFLPALNRALALRARHLNTSAV